jgi:predicted permease
MDSAILLFWQILKMAVFIFVGFLLCRVRLLKAETGGDFSNLLLYIVTPAVILSAYLEPYSSQKAQLLGGSFLLSLLIHLFFILVAHCFFKRDPLAQNAVVISNSGFMGIPLVGALLGSSAIFYLAAYMAVNTVVQWTYGASRFDSKQKISLRTTLITPIIPTVSVALLLFFLQVPVPAFLQTLLKDIGALNTPLAMIALGMFLSKITWSSLLKEGRYFIKPVLFRLVFLPVATIFLLSMLPQSMHLLAMTLWIVAASPTAISVALFAEKYHNDSGKATVLICISTLLSLITIPLLAILAQNLFY